MKFNTEFVWCWNAFIFGVTYDKHEFNALVVSIGFLHVMFTKEDEK